jgi:transcriptional regulator with XRE-family HTH domain
MQHLSTDVDETTQDGGIPEFSDLGKRIELRRIERRLTKGQLAGHAGISRQQLWRVMTGKSELTDALCARLAKVLQLDSRWLADALAPLDASFGELHRSTATASLAEYLADPAALERTLTTLPSNEEGRRVKLALLNEIEEIAATATLSLPARFFDLRREVVNGER